MKVDQVYHRNRAIWPFTVVGRPPQEDTSFGDLIHEITGSIIPKEIPGLHEVNAVDEAGVHPLLFAIGSERYTPYLENETACRVTNDRESYFGVWSDVFGKNFYSFLQKRTTLVYKYMIKRLSSNICWRE